MELSLNEDFLRYYNQDIIAKAGIKILYEISQFGENKASFKKIFDTRNFLFEKNPENVVLRNLADYFLTSLSTHTLKEQGKQNHFAILKKIDALNKETASLAAKKIKSGGVVFVHSITNQVYNTLLAASKYKKFSVNLIEHAPYNFGSSLAKKLDYHGIKATLYHDAWISHAVSSSDICLLGSDIIQKNASAIVKTGSVIAAESAIKNHIPVYVATHSLKYDYSNNMSNVLAQKLEPIEKYSSANVYEELSPGLISAYIAEHGIYKPESLIEEFNFLKGKKII